MDFIDDIGFVVLVDVCAAISFDMRNLNGFLLSLIKLTDASITILFFAFYSMMHAKHMLFVIIRYFNS